MVEGPCIQASCESLQGGVRGFPALLSLVYRDTLSLMRFITYSVCVHEEDWNEK